MVLLLVLPFDLHLLSAAPAGHGAVLRQVSEGGDRGSGDGPSLQREAADSKHRRHQGVLSFTPQSHEQLRDVSSPARQNGHLAKELDLVSHHVRTRLDELKRQEVSRLRMLFKAKLDSTNVQSEWAGPGLHPDPAGLTDGVCVQPSRWTTPPS